MLDMGREVRYVLNLSLDYASLLLMQILCSNYELFPLYFNVASYDDDLRSY